eukprot:13572211-Ditylum_brightwellii.AAC.1
MELYPKTNVYVKQDAFQRNAVVCPGSIINVYPTLVQKEDLENEIQAHMMKLSAPETEDATQWLSKYHPEYRTDQQSPVPDFKLVTASIKWGINLDRVNTTAFKILCAEKDGMYMKTLFTRTYEHQGCPRGLFLPAR